MRLHTPSVLIVSIIFLLGFFFQLSEASGISGSSISYGSNPVVSVGDYINGGHSFSISAPQTSGLLITDIHLSNGSGDSIIYAKLSNNTMLGRWHVLGGSPISTTMSSGILVPAGDTLTFSSSTNYYTTSATISGHYVHP